MTAITGLPLARDFACAAWATLRLVDASLLALADRRPIRSDPVSDRAQDPMMTACGIERSAQVVGPLRGPIIGVTEQRLGDADMLGVVNCQLGGHDLAKEVRIEIAAELAFCYAADDLSHFLCGQRLAGEADPERLAGHRRCRAHHEKRAVA